MEKENWTNLTETDAIAVLREVSSTNDTISVNNNSPNQRIHTVEIPVVEKTDPFSYYENRNKLIQTADSIALPKRTQKKKTRAESWRATTQNKKSKSKYHRSSNSLSSSRTIEIYFPYFVFRSKSRSNQRKRFSTR